MRKNEREIEMAKFELPIKPRYLPGEIPEIQRKTDLEYYKTHRLECANVRPKIDNRPPRLDPDVYYRRARMCTDTWAARERCKKNLELVKKINTIFRMGGKVDCWNFNDKKYKTDQTHIKNDLKRIELENKALYKKVNSLTSEYAPEVLAKDWKILKQCIIEKSRYPWFKDIPRYPSITKFSTVPIDSDKKINRSRCFFDLEVASSKVPLGRIVFELYADYVPSICANFESFCKGFNDLSYKGTPLHRIVSGYYCVGGDVTKFNGLGGALIYEDAIPEPENTSLQHSCPGVLSTYSNNDEARNIYDSKFLLSFRPLKTLDGKSIVFGKVVKGLSNLLKVDAYGTRFGKPLQKVIVSNCGVLLTDSKRNSQQRSSNQSKSSSTQKIKTIKNKKRKIRNSSIE